ncbi:phosphoethanolamine transferase CptA, partial [Escherichia coli]|nr:phosphoethanolamine transferase CptA [Escherichia coli]
MHLNTGQNRPTFSWCALGWAIFYFGFFSTLLQVIIFSSGYSGTNGIRDSLLFSCLWLIPVFLYPDRIKIIAAVVGFILWGTSLAALCYYFLYGHEFSQSVLFVMFETNAREAGEYFSQYFSLKLLLISLVYTAVSVFLWTRLRPVYIPLPWRRIVSFLLLYALLLHPVVLKSLIRQEPLNDTLGKLASRMEPAAPWQFVSSYYQYHQQLNALTTFLNENSALPPLGNLRDESGERPRTLVLVIGESTQRERMSLYGYLRETTPELDALRKTDPGLTVFNNVVASRPYTIEALQQALTFANEKNPDLYLTQPSLMNMMKQAGYKTFWITNQQTITARNTMLTVFSRQTDRQYYMNQQRTQSAREYDTNVLKPFREVLNDPAPKKLIIVHLLGTHIKYKYRYPEGQGRFDGITGHIPTGLNAKELEVYNDYDNANLFNDHVVASLIKDFRATAPDGFLLYFSDHGEEVYDT